MDVSAAESLSAVELIKARKRRPVQWNEENALGHDIREELFELEEKGEWIVHRVPEPYVVASTKYGRPKKIPLEHTWHHKSCGQCGHIPGYPTAVFWINRQLGFDYRDPFEQTSCTGWNYYASATSNPLAQAAVAARNFAEAYQEGYYPLIHCGTSFGHYKEVRHALVTHADLRRQVREILARMGKPLVIPEEIVHYSEWLFAVRHEIAKRKKYDVSKVVVCVHPACHYHKLIADDAIYDQEVYGGQRTAVITGVAQALGAQIGEYSTWYDCCGFGFRHILVQRDFTRSFANTRKIEVMKAEADPDVVLTNDTGCVTTLDKSQWAARAHGKDLDIPVMSDAQFAALAMGAHPFKVCQLHWHTGNWRPLLEKMGIDWQAAWEEFQEELERIRRGEKEFLTWGDAGA